MSKTFKKLLLILLAAFLVAFAFIVIIKSLATGITDSKGGDTISVTGVAEGQNVKVNNPAQSANFEAVGADVYISDERKLGPDVGFSVAYYEEDGSFAIDISGKPTAVYRQKASEYILQTLQITEAEACRLNVYIGVTNATDPNLVGQNLGLSFCPGSVQL
jgi:hypothetical protein